MIKVAAHLKKNNFRLFCDGDEYTNYSEETFESIFPDKKLVVFTLQKGEGEAFDETELLLQINSPCPDHKEKFLMFYCFDCGNSICSECFSKGVHKGHHIQDKCYYLLPSKFLVQKMFESWSKNPYEDYKPYDDEELEEIYEGYNKNNVNNSNNDNNKKENNNNSDKERYIGNVLFKEESANFITQLKKRDKINSFAFSIKYNSDDNGEIIIGDLPHEYAPDKYSSSNYFFDTVSITKEPPFNWHFTYKKCLYGEEEIDKSNMVKLSIDFGFIKGNTKLKNYLENNFFEVNPCYKNRVNDYDIFYCFNNFLYWLYFNL